MLFQCGGCVLRSASPRAGRARSVTGLLKRCLPTNSRILRYRYDNRENNEVVEFSVSHQDIRSTWDICVPHAMEIRRTGGLGTERAIKRGEERMIKAITVSMCLAASSL